MNKNWIEIDGVRHCPMDKMDYRVILSLAKNDMRPTDAGYEMDLHRGTVMYRIDKIKRLTGLDPRKFYDLIKLVEMARKELADG